MSNWARAKVTFKKVETDLLEESLAAMGYGINYDGHTVRGYYSREGSRDCDCVLVDLKTNEPAEIGLKFSKDEETGEVIVNVVGDWYLKKYNDKTFTQALKLEYSTSSMNRIAKQNGYVIKEVEALEEYKRRILYVKAA